MFKNKKFVKFCLRFMCWFRRIYSPVIFWLLWIIWIRWFVRIDEKYAAKVIWEEILHASTITEFREKLKRYDWVSEPAGGLLDFSYQIPWLNFCGTIPVRWGRDCDDFAELSWRWCEIHCFEKVWQVMSMRDTIKSAHIITVAYSGGIYAVLSNTDRVWFIAAESLDKALEGYYPEGTAWSVYKEDSTIS